MELYKYYCQLEVVDQIYCTRARYTFTSAFPECTLASKEYEWVVQIKKKEGICHKGYDYIEPKIPSPPVVRDKQHGTERGKCH